MHHTNNDCHTVQVAAALLKMSNKALYKKLREIGWLHIGTLKDGLHNQPKSFAIKNGWLTTEDRGRAAPFNKQMTLIYSVPVITQKGFLELKKIVEQNALPPKPIPLTVENAQRIQQKSPSPAALQERERTMNELKKMGLAQ